MSPHFASSPAVGRPNPHHHPPWGVLCPAGERGLWVATPACRCACEQVQKPHPALNSNVPLVIPSCLRAHCAGSRGPAHTALNERRVLGPPPPSHGIFQHRLSHQCPHHLERLAICRKRDCRVSLAETDASTARCGPARQYMRNQHPCRHPTCRHPRLQQPGWHCPGVDGGARHPRAAPAAGRHSCDRRLWQPEQPAASCRGSGVPARVNALLRLAGRPVLERGLGLRGARLGGHADCHV